MKRGALPRRLRTAGLIEGEAMTKHEIIELIGGCGDLVMLDSQEIRRAFIAGQHSPATVAKLRVELRYMLSLLSELSAEEAPKPAPAYDPELERRLIAFGRERLRSVPMAVGGSSFPPRLEGDWCGEHQPASAVSLSPEVQQILAQVEG